MCVSVCVCLLPCFACHVMHEKMSPVERDKRKEEEGGGGRGGGMWRAWRDDRGRKEREEKKMKDRGMMQRRLGWVEVVEEDPDVWVWPEAENLKVWQIQIFIKSEVWINMKESVCVNPRGCWRKAHCINIQVSMPPCEQCVCGCISACGFCVSLLPLCPFYLFLCPHMHVSSDRMCVCAYLCVSLR